MSIAKKCLLIGINYTNSSYALNGCINDSLNLKLFLTKNKFFKSSDIIMMNDKQGGSNYPSKRNILKQLKNLIKFANSNKSKKVHLFVSYSGHGTYMTDKDGDEEDGRDEVLCPIDCDSNGYLTDDTVKKQFISKLPRNVKLVMLIDSCHSGTIMDLKFNYAIDRMNTYTTYGNMAQTKCQVVMISGCQDKQTSSDAYLKDKNTKKYEYQGAMTASFLLHFKNNINYHDLITNMRKWLKNSKFDQIPQLSSGRHINVKKTFLLNSY